MRWGFVTIARGGERRQKKKALDAGAQLSSTLGACECGSPPEARDDAAAEPRAALLVALGEAVHHLEEKGG